MPDSGELAPAIEVTVEQANSPVVDWALAEARLKGLGASVILRTPWEVQSVDDRPVALVGAVWMDGMRGRLYVAQGPCDEFQRARWSELESLRPLVLFVEGHGDGGHVHGGVFTICAAPGRCRERHKSGRVLKPASLAGQLTVILSCNSATYGAEQSASGDTLLRGFLEHGTAIYAGIAETGVDVASDCVPDLWRVLRGGLPVGRIGLVRAADRMRAVPSALRVHGDPAWSLKRQEPFRSALGDVRHPVALTDPPFGLAETGARGRETMPIAALFATLAQQARASRISEDAGSPADHFAAAHVALDVSAAPGQAVTDLMWHRALRRGLEKTRWAPMIFTGLHEALLDGLVPVALPRSRVSTCETCGSGRRMTEHWSQEGLCRRVTVCPRCGPLENLDARTPSPPLALALDRDGVTLARQQPSSVGAASSSAWGEVRTRDVQRVLARIELAPGDVLARASWSEEPPDDDTLLRLWSVSCSDDRIDLRQQRAYLAGPSSPG